MRRSSVPTTILTNPWRDLLEERAVSMGKEFTHGLAVDVGGVRVGEGVDGEGVGEGAELASVARSVATLPEGL